MIGKYKNIWTDKEIKGANVAIYYIYLWVNSMITFFVINKESQPLRDKLEKVSQILEEKTEVLEEKRKNLKKCQD